MQRVKSTRIVFCLDTSGSMSGLLPSAIDALNRNVRSIEKSAKERDQDATISLITFNSLVSNHFFNRSAMAVRPIGKNDISTDGMTALWDATTLGITQMRDAPIGCDEDVSYLLIVITDGEENRSRAHASDLQSLIRTVENTDRWTISFLVPRGYRRRLISDLQLHDGNVMEWDQTSSGIKEYEQATEVSINRYFDARAKGVNATTGFFATDLTHVTQTVVNELDNMTKRSYVYDVKEDGVEIGTFIRSHIGAYSRGSAYYQLSKPEDIQDYKSLLLMKHGNRTVYGGSRVRSLLGLPDHHIRVRPGDHAGYDIFVQSTSTNRKLKSGTRLVYLHSPA